MTEQFKEQDLVEWQGCLGRVKSTSASGYNRPPVAVEFVSDPSTVHRFFPDGKLMDWHKEPALKLVDRPTEKIPYPEQELE